MAVINHVMLLGNLTRDPELRYTTTGKPVAEFSLAMSHRWKTEAGEEREEVCFVECCCFGKQAESFRKFFSKGKPVLITGRLRQEKWADKNTGAKRSKIVVVVEEWQFTERSTNPAAPEGETSDVRPPGGKASPRPPTDGDVPF